MILVKTSNKKPIFILYILYYVGWFRWVRIYEEFDSDEYTRQQVRDIEKKIKEELKRKFN